jgi:formylglycine-generating enzyme required for sulfatase activity
MELSPQEKTRQLIQDNVARLNRAREDGDIKTVRHCAEVLVSLGLLEYKAQAEKIIQDLKTKQMKNLYDRWMAIESSNRRSEKKEVLVQLIRLGETGLEPQLKAIIAAEKRSKRFGLYSTLILFVLGIFFTGYWLIVKNQQLNENNIHRHAKNKDAAYLIKGVQTLQKNPGKLNLMLLAISELAGLKSDTALNFLEDLFFSSDQDAVKQTIIDAFNRDNLTFKSTDTLLQQLIAAFPGRTQEGAMYPLYLDMAKNFPRTSVFEYFRVEENLPLDAPHLGALYDLRETFSEEDNLALFKWIGSYLHQLEGQTALKAEIARLEAENPPKANLLSALRSDLQSMQGWQTTRKATLRARFKSWFEQPPAQWQPIDSAKTLKAYAQSSRPPFSSDLSARTQRLYKNANGLWEADFAGIVMVFVPESEFTMGSDDKENSARRDEKPAHAVYLDHFWIGKYEVTQLQYKTVMGSLNPVQLKKIPANLPQEQISWLDAQEFIGRLNSQTNLHFRLPSEAEWERACSAGGHNRHYWGDRLDPEYFWADEKLHPIGQKLPNAYGLFDMNGNLAEWCLDWYDQMYYTQTPNADPWGPISGINKVIRGGSSKDYGNVMRSAYRNFGPPELRDKYTGIRLALDDF